MLNNYKKITLPEITDDNNNERADKWLALQLEDLSRSRIKHFIEKSCIYKNGTVLKDADYKIQTGDIFDVFIPPVEAPIPKGEKIDLNIIYEDEDLIVINKTPDMVIHPAAGNHSGTLVNALIEHCGDSLSGIGGIKRPGIVHRIDKDTSGLIVAAKNDYAHNYLAEQFAEHSIERAYKAVVWNIPNPTSGKIVANIGRSKTNRKKMAMLDRGGKPAITNYKTIKVIKNIASVVECRLETGRTHQIRVHMTNIKCPLVGDQTYGNNNKFIAKYKDNKFLNDFKRQALHAFKLGFIHPRSKQKICFDCELPEDMKLLITSLEQ